MLPLIQIYPPLLKSVLLFIFILFIFNFRFFSSILKPVNRKDWAIFSVIFLSALILRLFVIPHTHQIDFDEVEHINIAENILYANQFCECYAGSNQKCEVCRLMPWPPGYHTFLSLMFSLFGDSEQTAFNSNAVIGSITVLLIFLLVFLETKNSSLALIASFLFNLIPVHLKFSGTATMDNFSVFFVILSLISLNLYRNTRRYAVFLLFLSVLLYAVHARPENFLLIPVVFFYLGVTLEEPVKSLFQAKYLISILVFFALLTPLVQLFHYGSLAFPSWAWNVSLPIKFNHFGKHLLPNLGFFVDPHFNSFLFPIFCILGCHQLYLRDRKLLACYGFLFFAFFFVYSSYFTGRFSMGDTARYSLILYIPLTIISSGGVWLIFKKFCFEKKALMFLLILLFLTSLWPVKSFVFSKSKHDNEYQFVLSMKNKLPSDVYVISYNAPMIISTIHKKSMTPSEFLGNYVETLKLEDKVVLFKDFWWQERVKESGEIERVLKKYYTFQLLEENSGYGFYSLTKKT